MIVLAVRQLIVVVVEDDELFAKALVRLLRARCEVRLAGSLTAALPLVARGGFDVLLCDWDLGDGNAREALALCATAAPAARRVILSARPYTFVSERASDVADLILEKPVDPGVLQRAIGLPRPRAGRGGPA